MGMPKLATNLFLLIAAIVAQSALAADPIGLHPQNAHYFLFRDKPTILITSAEHYGAVLNADFDSVKYLDELAACGLNHTRLFSGAYVEPDGAFNIRRNTLAPAPGKYLAPWGRSDQPGYANGGNRFDLTKWDQAFFTRLKDFVAQAGRRGIVVEMNLFCPMYEDLQWKLTPMNPMNNINGIGQCDKHQVYTLDKEPRLLAVQEAMVRKFVDELKPFDNLFYEVCNEPYFGGVTMAWQHHVIDVIVEAEKSMPKPHLIAMNIANGSQKIDRPHPSVSIFNFHYSYPPTAVEQNYGLNKVIGENETGFKGTADAHYRHEAWQFVLAGGGLFNNLDYSFTVGHEDGTFEYPTTQPGGGNRGFRHQLKILKDFLNGFDFIHMKPDSALVSGELPQGVQVQLLSDGKRQHAVYVQGGKKIDLPLSIPAGDFRAEWIDVLTGKVVKQEQRKHAGGEAKFTSPDYGDDIAFRLIMQ
jgi:hypothetical protein